MITFIKKSARDSISDTTILLHDDGITIVTNRFLNKSQCRVITTCDGTTMDFNAKVDAILSLNDTMYERFGLLQASRLC